ncbi:MAG: hypothetical protein IT463_02765 [Planctomycetes bacterium]|nr:hypothetical protein [Planctomycetota bacterium]
MRTVSGIALCGLAGLLLAGQAVAQEGGIPPNRVRQVRGNTVTTDTLYLQNRVVFRRIDVTSDGYGMQLAGELFTDFECDKPAPDSGLRPGQMMGVRVDIKLYQENVTLKRHNNAIKEPKLEPGRYGPQVDTQAISATAEVVEEGLGLARFQMPALTKPLAPGVYRMVASVTFKAQPAPVVKGLKWCSAWYGELDEGLDPVTNERLLRPVWGDPELHEKTYKELLDNFQRVQTEAVIYVADTLRGDKPENMKTLLRAPAQAKGNAKANILVWDTWMETIGWVQLYENQLAQIPVDLKKDLDNPDLPADVKKRRKKEAEQDEINVKDLIQLHGGKCSKEETRLYMQATAARTDILEQIKLFQEYLQQRYWCLVDGWLLYGGFHSINHPGYNAWEAVQSQNKNTSREKREEKLRKANDEGGEAAFTAKLEETWKFDPAEARNVAKKYLTDKVFKDRWDGNKFVATREKLVVLDLVDDSGQPGKWAAYRNNFISEFRKETDRVLGEIDTGVLYATQVWPEVVAEARSARDDVIALALSWEFQIRTAAGKRNEATEPLIEDPKAVMQSWQDEDLNRPAEDKLAAYFQRAQIQPGALKTQFDAHMVFIKDKIDLVEFTSAYRRAIEGGAQGAILPGSKPKWRDN